MFGLEAQGNWADFSGSNVSLRSPRFRNHTNVDAFGLFTGQVGYAVNNVLLYVKGGAAVTSNSYRVNTFGGALARRHRRRHPLGRHDRRRPRIRLRSELVGSASSTITCSCRTVPTTSPRRPALAFGADRIRQDVDLVTARLNYRFGGPAIARY